jgi:hypothetical protein
MFGALFHCRYIVRRETVLTYSGSTHPLKIEHRLGVKAPASVVWEILADVPSWPTWSTIYSKASGVIGYGERLKLELALPGQPPQAIEPIIYEWEPHEVIHWRLKSMMGMIETIRFLEVDALSDTGCIFANGEIHGGLMGPSKAAIKQRALLRAGFTAMGEAMRDRAEALWRERGGEAT